MGTKAPITSNKKMWKLYFSHYYYYSTPYRFLSQTSEALTLEVH